MKLTGRVDECRAGEWTDEMSSWTDEMSSWPNFEFGDVWGGIYIRRMLLCAYGKLTITDIMARQY